MFLKGLIKKMLPGFLLEVVQARHRLKQQIFILNRNSERIARILEGPNLIKLELGAGLQKKEGWISVDMNNDCDLNLDLTESIPFPDNSVSNIYSSHVLEHFKTSELMRLLNECRRVLKPGGILSAAVPNAKIYLDAYSNPEAFSPSEFCRYAPAYSFNSPIDYVNYIAYMDGHHKHMFDEDNIIAILENAGFRNVERRSFDGNLDLQERDYESIYVQAEK